MPKWKDKQPQKSGVSFPMQQHPVVLGTALFPPSFSARQNNFWIKSWNREDNSRYVVCSMSQQTWVGSKPCTLINDGEFHIFDYHWNRYIRCCVETAGWSLTCRFRLTPVFLCPKNKRRALLKVSAIVKVSAIEATNRRSSGEHWPLCPFSASCWQSRDERCLSLCAQWFNYHNGRWMGRFPRQP